MRLLRKWDRGFLSLERVLLILFVYYVLFGFIFPQIAYLIQGDNALLGPGQLEVEYQCLVYLVAIIPCLILVFPLLKAERKISYRRIIESFLVVILLGFLINFIFNTIIIWIQGEYVSSDNEAALGGLSLQNKWLFLSMSLLLAPLLEEIVFRGVIFGQLRVRYNFYVSALVSGLLFGLIHVIASIVQGNFIEFVYLFLYAGLGILFCAVYEYNRNIYSCIAVHMLYNTCASLSVILS